MKKKYVLLILGLLSVLALVFIFFKLKSKEDQISISPPRPKIPSGITGNLPIKVSVSKQDFDFPERLPTISISKRSISKNDVISFAKKLGLEGEVEEFEDINEGFKYFINSDNYFFLVTPKTSIAKYGLTNSDFPKTTSKNLPEIEITNIATNFLIENGFYTSDEVKKLPITYLKKGTLSEGLEKTTKDQAEVFQVGFYLSSSDYEILTTDSTNPSIFVQILPNGEIYNSEILLLNDLQKGITDYPIKNYDDLNNSLGEARLITLSGDYISTLDLTIKDVISLNVEKIRLAYLLEENNNTLQPIFILEGPAKIIDSEANFATLYIPAYK